MAHLLGKKRPEQRVRVRTTVDGKMAKSSAAGSIIVDTRDGSPVRYYEFGDMDAAKRSAEKMRRTMGVAGPPFARGDTPMSEAHINVKKGAFRTSVEWSFKTNSILASETESEGVIGISREVAEQLRIRPREKAIVRCAGRSKTMSVRVREHVRHFEVELDEDDIAELGLSDGMGGYLEVLSEGAGERSGKSADGTPGRRRENKQPARKVMVGKGCKLETDNERPPYEVEKGFEFWKRRKRA